MHIMYSYILRQFLGSFHAAKSLSKVTLYISRAGFILYKRLSQTDLTASN